MQLGERTHFIFGSLVSALFTVFATACGGGADGSQAPAGGDPGAPPSQDLASAPVDDGTSVGASSGAITATTDPTPSPPATNGWRPLPLRGMNLAGGDGGPIGAPSTLPGADGVAYAFPGADDVDYFMSKGMNTFRVPFVWERIQPYATTELNAQYLASMDKLVTYATSKGAHVVIEPHNFARYYGNLVGSAAVPNAAFADLWGRLAAHYLANDHVSFDLVNEPHDIPTEQWVSAANAAIAAIRATGSKTMIVVPGNGWTAGASWASSSYGTPNAVALLAITDPADNVVFEAHQYLDADMSGTNDQCVSATIGSQRLAAFVDWLRANEKKGILGEFAAGDNPTCRAAIADMMKYVGDQSDVLVGWLWWASGPWFRNYQFSLFPKNGVEAPYMTALGEWLAPVTPVRRVTTQTASSYCADVELYEWADRQPAVLASVALDLFDARATTTTGATLSATTGAASATPATAIANVPKGGKTTLSVCADLGPSKNVLSVLGASSR